MKDYACLAISYIFSLAETYLILAGFPLF